MTEQNSGFRSPIYLVFLAILAGSSGLSAKAPAIPVHAVLDFTVLRDDETIGQHRIELRRKGDVLQIDTRARIAVDILFFTVYRFEWDAREIWRNGQLLSMTSRVHDDGTDHLVTASRNASGGLDIVSDGHKSTLNGAMIPVSFWNAAIVHSTANLDPLVGRPLQIRLTYRGEESIQVKSRPVRTKHYSMTGELERELWYDDNASLAKMTLIGKDGSLVRYELK